MRGRLITVEGIDGVGKTTHTARLVNYLTQLGFQVATYREPGGTPLGEQLRLLIKAGSAQSALSELLLFAAARAELVTTRIRPDMQQGVFVVLDRFTDSTWSYQGALDDIPEEALNAVCAAAADKLAPDLTLWLDLSPEEAYRRRYPLAGEMAAGEIDPATQPSELDAIERRDVGYFQRVRARYLSLAQAEPQRIARIDASGTLEQTATMIRARLDERLKQWVAAGKGARRSGTEGNR